MTEREFKEATGRPLSYFHHDCHNASAALVRSGVLGECRVARGSCPGVSGQHSWVVLGMDCYDHEATVIDPTLWSYDPRVKGIWQGLANELPHEPPRMGSIWEWGKPAPATGDVIELDRAGLSEQACVFLELLGPLDRRGWMCLANDAPVQEWPAGEIYGAMYEDARLDTFVPIDLIGMLTDKNPMGVYLPGGELEVMPG